MAVRVVDLFEVVQVHHEKCQRVVLEGVPWNILLKIVVKKSAVIKTGEFVFEDQARRIFSKVLKLVYEPTIIHALGPMSKGYSPFLLIV